MTSRTVSTPIGGSNSMYACGPRYRRSTRCHSAPSQDMPSPSDSGYGSIDDSLHEDCSFARPPVLSNWPSSFDRPTSNDSWDSHLDSEWPQSRSAGDRLEDPSSQRKRLHRIRSASFVLEGIQPNDIGDRVQDTRDVPTAAGVSPCRYDAHTLDRFVPLRCPLSPLFERYRTTFSVTSLSATERLLRHEDSPLRAFMPIQRESLVVARNSSSIQAVASGSRSPSPCTSYIHNVPPADADWPLPEKLWPFSHHGHKTG